MRRDAHARHSGVCSARLRRTLRAVRSLSGSEFCGHASRARTDRSSAHLTRGGSGCLPVTCPAWKDQSLIPAGSKRERSYFFHGQLIAAYTVRWVLWAWSSGLCGLGVVFRVLGGSTVFPAVGRTARMLCRRMQRANTEINPVDVNPAGCRARPVATVPGRNHSPAGVIAPAARNPARSGSGRGRDSESRASCDASWPG